MKKYMSHAIVALASALATYGIVQASTTISTDITTAGSLTAATSTLATTTISSLTVTGSCSGCGATPGSSSSTVQFNANGFLGGNTNFTFDGSTLIVPNLTVNGATQINGSLSASIIPLQDTAANLSSVVASSGQMVYETDTKYSKAGDGVTSIGSIPPIGFWRNDGSNIYYTNGAVSVGNDVSVSTSPYPFLSVISTSGSGSPLLAIASSTNGAGTTTALSVAMNGYVGIGTSTPSYPLHIFVSTTTYLNGIAYEAALDVHTTSGVVSNGFGPGLLFRDSPGGAGTANMAGIAAVYDNSAVSSNYYGDLVFLTNGSMSGNPSEAMRILYNGHVGIGTANPVADLQVATSSANSTTSVELGKSGQTKGTCLKMYDSGGTAVYISFGAGSLTPIYSHTACASMNGF